MDRRQLLKTLGAASALALLPHDAMAAWERVSARTSAPIRDPHDDLVSAIADTLLPRTDSPSATDVAVPAFVSVIVNEQYADADRTAFLAGLDAIASRARELTGGTFGAATPEMRARVIEALEAATDRRSDPQRTYWRLKDLIIHGYFTSEPVMKNVLQYEVMPGRYDGNVLIQATPR